MSRFRARISGPIQTGTPPDDPPDKNTSLADEQDSIPTDDKPKSPSD